MLKVAGESLYCLSRSHLQRPGSCDGQNQISMGSLRKQKTDTISFARQNCSIKSNGRLLQVISFSGKPEVPSYAFKTILLGTPKYQKHLAKLSASDWKNDEKLKMSIGTWFNTEKIVVSHPEIGKLGYLSPAITNILKPLMEKGYQFEAELSDLDGGPDRGSFIKLRLGVKYKLKEGEKLKDIPPEVTESIKQLKSKISNIFPYQPVVSPDEMMDIIAPEPAVNNILKEIKKAKSILLVGHQSPDGDTVGCILALRAALDAVGKKADCSIDDDIDGILRHKLPGIDEHLKKAEAFDPDSKYDLVFVMDTPIPQRLGENSKLIKNAKKVIFIDHHPLTEEKWKDSSVNVKKIQKDGLVWVRPEMPAASEMITGLIFKLLPENIKNSLSAEQKKAIAVPLVTGMATDTEFFKKGAALNVESISKFLMNWADFGKKWIRDNIHYNLPDPALKKLHKYCKEGITIDKKANFASLQVPHDKFMDIYNTAKEDDKDVILLDVVNGIKFSQIFNSLRKDPKTHRFDKTAAMIVQREVKEEEGRDFISVNLRSGQNTSYAKKIAIALGGGGHDTMAAAQIYGHKLDEKFYDDKDNPDSKLTLERKIAQLARQFTDEAKSKLVSFTGKVREIMKAG